MHWGKFLPKECPGHDIKQSDGFQLGYLGNVEYPFIAIATRSTLAQSGSSWFGPIYGSNRTIWIIKRDDKQMNC